MVALYLPEESPLQRGVSMGPQPEQWWNGIHVITGPATILWFAKEISNSPACPSLVWECSCQNSDLNVWTFMIKSLAFTEGSDLTFKMALRFPNWQIQWYCGTGDGGKIPHTHTGYTSILCWMNQNRKKVCPGHNNYFSRCSWGSLFPPVSKAVSVKTLNSLKLYIAPNIYIKMQIMNQMGNVSHPHLSGLENDLLTLNTMGVVVIILWSLSHGDEPDGDGCRLWLWLRCVSTFLFYDIKT